MDTGTCRSKKKTLLIVLLGAVAAAVVLTGVFVCGKTVLGLFAPLEVNTDISRYNDHIGANAPEPYQNKWDMDETIFPAAITEDMDVADYKMVYYDPWDAQYLSYLVVNYGEEAYRAELERLEGYDSTEYLGYYGVTGFTNYDLLAIYADDYQGFVYAMTDGQGQIIYVELIFCNYFMDLDYREYMDSKYLPDGFDATLDNAYQRSKGY